MYTWTEERVISASEDNFQSAQLSNQCESFNFLAPTIQDTEISACTLTGIEYIVRTWTVFHKKRNSLDLSLQIPRGLTVRQAHWDCVDSTHDKQSTDHRVTGGQEGPCAQPSLLKQTEKPHPPTLYYIQCSQWHHWCQWDTHSKWRLRRPEPSRDV